MAAAILEQLLEEGQLDQALRLPPEPPPCRKRFTRAEVERMLEAGLFEDQRCELIDGDLIDKMGQNPPHASSIRLISDYFRNLLGDGRVLVQAPIEVAAGDQKWSWPEPDVAVLAHPSLEYQRRHPRGDELLVLVEVADTTVRYDSIRKRNLYARAGVPEYWVLAVSSRALVVHRNLVQGQYEQVLLYSETDEVNLGPHSIAIAKLLPRKAED
jgi:Uma2 family endonuclease